MSNDFILRYAHITMVCIHIGNRKKHYCLHVISVHMNIDKVITSFKSYCAFICFSMYIQPGRVLGTNTTANFETHVNQSKHSHRSVTCIRVFLFMSTLSFNVGASSLNRPLCHFLVRQQTRGKIP